VTTTVATPLAALHGVRFAYPRPGREPLGVLRGIDLEVAAGERVALLGPNGSGKTTMLRLLSGALRPDAGSVALAGRPLTEWSRLALARQVAVLPQQLDLPEGFRVVELVAMGRAPHARSLFGSTAADEAAVRRALDDADALDLADRLPHELSGGERQRVLVAMALAQEPQLLLLDEPTLHLDLAHQVGLLRRLRTLHSRRALTIVAVLHDLNLAAAFAPRVALLADGVVAADGRPDDVLTPDLVSRVFGVSVEAVPTSDGRRQPALRLD
jgi:iron complex transport system ATP-binding protein